MGSITIDRAVLEQALKLLDDAAGYGDDLSEIDAAYAIIQEALAAPQPEPHFAKRWNIERDGSGALLICFGDHEKGDGCLFTRYVEQDAQPEPVAFYDFGNHRMRWAKPTVYDQPVSVDAPELPLYTHPPQRQHDEIEALKAERDALLDKIKAVIAAEQSEGAGCGGFANTPPTKEHRRRVAWAWQHLHKTIAAIDAARGE